MHHLHIGNVGLSTLLVTLKYHEYHEYLYSEEKYKPTYFDNAFVLHID